jgi:hypothetical protein
MAGYCLGGVVASFLATIIGAGIIDKRHNKAVEIQKGKNL